MSPSADNPNAPVQVDDTERQCPTACYTISVAICKERQRRKYYECPACDWSGANQEKNQQKADAEKYRQRYGF